MGKVAGNERVNDDEVMICGRNKVPFGSDRRWVDCESGNEGLRVERVCLVWVLGVVRIHVRPEHKGM